MSKRECIELAKKLDRERGQSYVVVRDCDQDGLPYVVISYDWYVNDDGCSYREQDVVFISPDEYYQ